jgi:squalene-associated FAD-dependent desaturase
MGEGEGSGARIRETPGLMISSPDNPDFKGLPSVGIAGGGLAGLAAACALADSGFRVTLFERRPFLGGRASSYQHPGTGEVVDNCQHVLLGCCTNLLDFYDRIGVTEKVAWYNGLTFLEPGGRESVISASSLPAPFHTTPSFLSASCLSVRDKLGIARAMLALMPSLPSDSDESFLTWLRRHGQTKQAIERFWKTVLVSALNEELDRVSITYAAQVFRESFLKSAAAGRMGVPRVPLTELYSAAGDYIRARGGEVRLRASVEQFSMDFCSKVSLGSGEEQQCFDYVILALPFQGLDRLLGAKPEAKGLRAAMSHFESSPITGIHLWFDRPITALDHAVLLDRTIQWMFHKSKLLGRMDAQNGSYVELVVSSSKSLVEKSKQEIVELALRELQEFFPASHGAILLKSAVIKEVHATYSPSPGIDAFRPTNATVWPQVFLAGDWTSTGWPATMEGAVRSGYLAAQAVTETAGKPTRFLVPDLPATGLMRLFKR